MTFFSLIVCFLSFFIFYLSFILSSFCFVYCTQCVLSRLCVGVLISLLVTHPVVLQESDYFTPQGEFRVDAAGSQTLLNCLMYKLSYYRFGQMQVCTASLMPARAQSYVCFE